VRQCARPGLALGYAGQRTHPPISTTPVAIATIRHHPLLAPHPSPSPPSATTAAHPPPPGPQVKKADQLNAIALVMASHNKGRVAEFFLGSCTSYVTHHAHRPVVVVPPAPKAA
jgi:hypothetical protein